MTSVDSPSAYVIDASVTAGWLLPDERTPAAERAFTLLRQGQLEVHAPDLWLWECGNIIASAVKRKRVALSDTAALWQLLHSVRLCVNLKPTETSHVQSALALAVDDGLSIYDAAYLWTAMSMQLPLLTHDRRLHQVATAHGVVCLGWAELT